MSIGLSRAGSVRNFEQRVVKQDREAVYAADVEKRMDRARDSVGNERRFLRVKKTKWQTGSKQAREREMSVEKRQRRSGGGRVCLGRYPRQSQGNLEVPGQPTVARGVHGMPSSHQSHLLNFSSGACSLGDPDEARYLRRPWHWQPGTPMITDFAHDSKTLKTQFTLPLQSSIPNPTEFPVFGTPRWQNRDAH